MPCIFFVNAPRPFNVSGLNDIGLTKFTRSAVTMTHWSSRNAIVAMRPRWGTDHMCERTRDKTSY